MAQEEENGAGGNGQVLSKLEKSILTASNIAKDLEANISHIQQLARRVGTRSTDAAAQRDHFARTLVEGQEIIQFITSSTQQFAHMTEQTTQEMSSVANAFRETAMTFGKLKHTGEKLSKFVSVIQDLADQTKLLALNARIEAERAGEHGRGFSVVADEVRALSAESKRSSTEVYSSIESFTQILQRFERDLTRQLSRFDQSQERLTKAGEMALSVEAQIHRMVDAFAHMEDILATLEHVDSMEYSLQQATISCDNLKRYVTRSLGLHHKIVSDSGSPHDTAVAGQLMTDLYQAILTEDHKKSSSLIESALQAGETNLHLLDVVATVCERIMYEQKMRKLTLSELYINGTILEDILDKIIPGVEVGHTRDSGRGTIVLGNAFGDYHSLGRKMVGVLLQATGYRVFDLGMSVCNDKLIETALEHDARLIGISALLLHTASEVTKLRQQLDDMGRQDIKIMVGGAPFLIDERLNETVRANFVACSAAEGVDLANYVFGEGNQHE
ncbi:MAG: methyl-accepting chemotaxis protein [bacterium]